MFHRTCAFLLAGCIVSALTLVQIASAQTTWYVDDDASLGGDGTSWPTAFTYLQDALEQAASGDVIRVAGGTYLPDQDEDDPNTATPGDRETAFRLTDAVEMYGGYRGLEPNEPGDPNDRDITHFASVLSGDIGSSGETHDNCYHVVTGSNTTETTILNGFSITSGRANGSSLSDKRGGGMTNVGGSPTVERCTFSENSAARLGGGMHNRSGAPTVRNCTFTGNSADYAGGGVSNSQSSDPTLTNCLFVGNSAGDFGGGAIYNEDSSSPTLIQCVFDDNSAAGGGGGIYNYRFCSPTLVNCVFSENSADRAGAIYNYRYSAPILINCCFCKNSATGFGGALYSYYGDLLLANCTFTENSAADGGAMYNRYSYPTLVNCILWLDSPDEIYDSISNATASYSDIQGGWPGDGNIDADPLFADANNGDYHLLSNSPCIDAGNNTVVPADNLDLDGDGDPNEPLPLDLDRRLRFADRIGTVDTGVADPNFPELEVVDMGAYEYQCTGDLNGDGEIDLSDLAALLAAYRAGSGALYPDGDLDQDGDVDLSDLAALLAVYRTTCE